MPLTKTLMPSGGSKALVLPKPFLDAIGAENEVDLTLKDDQIIVTAHRYVSDAQFEQSRRRVVAKSASLMKRLAKR